MATKKPGHTVADEQAIEQITKRLRRAEGQIGGIIRMIEDGRSCEDIITQMSAVSKAVDRAAFSLISTGLRECLTEGKRDSGEIAEQLQKLFLTMA